MAYHIYSFEKLDVYQSALQLSVDLRLIMNAFPSEENFGLKRQIRRATDSISSNIAEGSGRASNLDQAHFTNIAYSSALEVINHLNLALKLNFITSVDYHNMRILLDKVINQLNALYKYQINNSNNLKEKTKDKNK